MAKRLGVGIVGLGRRWQRYRQALLLMRSRLDVRATYDPLTCRAESAAKLFDCTATGGCAELLERPDVEALLLLDRRWFGLWPLQRACALGKPVFCAIPLAADDAHADRLRAGVEAARLPVLMACPLTCAPALDSLRSLLADSLGPPRLVRADCALRAPTDRSPPLLQTTTASALLRVCADLLGSPPTRVQASIADNGEAVSLLLEHGEGRVAQIHLCRGPAVRPACRIDVLTPRGTARARLPGRLCWRDADIQYAERRPCPAAEDALLEGFVQALASGQTPRPSFEDAYRCLSWLRAALSPQTVHVGLPEPA
jgi:predicted dehydrogenase